MSDSERPVVRPTTDTAARPWHALDAQAAAAELGVSTTVGLTPAEASARLATDGPNELGVESGPTIPQLILAQVANPMVYLLAGAGAVAPLAGKVFDAVVILPIVIANVVIGVLQEYRAEAALDALRSSRARAPACSATARSGSSRRSRLSGRHPRARDGRPSRSRCADLTESDLRVDESALTGESEPVEKSVEPLAESTPLADRSRMVYSSTPVVAGRATALVVATGMAHGRGRDRRRGPLDPTAGHAAAGAAREALGAAGHPVGGRGSRHLRARRAARRDPRRDGCCSRSPRPSRRFPKACPRRSASRSPSGCSAWRSATRSSGGSLRSRRSAVARSCAPTRPAR